MRIVNDKPKYQYEKACRSWFCSDQSDTTENTDNPETNIKSESNHMNETSVSTSDEIVTTTMAYIDTTTDMPLRSEDSVATITANIDAVTELINDNPTTATVLTTVVNTVVTEIAATEVTTTSEINAKTVSSDDYPATDSNISEVTTEQYYDYEYTTSDYYNDVTPDYYDYEYSGFNFVDTGNGDDSYYYDNDIEATTEYYDYNYNNDYPSSGDGSDYYTSDYYYYNNNDAALAETTENYEYYDTNAISEDYSEESTRTFDVQGDNWCIYALTAWFLF